MRKNLGLTVSAALILGAGCFVWPRAIELALDNVVCCEAAPAAVLATPPLPLATPTQPEIVIAGPDQEVAVEQDGVALNETTPAVPEPPERPIAAESGHTDWVADALKEMQTVHAGMTRADLLKVFEAEGGISTRTRQQFAYHGCPYFKVEVGFAPVGEADDDGTADADRVVKISRPFLEWGIDD